MEKKFATMSPTLGNDLIRTHFEKELLFKAELLWESEFTELTFFSSSLESSYHSDQVGGSHKIGPWRSGEYRYPEKFKKQNVLAGDTAVPLCVVRIVWFS